MDEYIISQSLKLPPSGENLLIKKGLSDALIEQLIKQAKEDTSVGQFTSDPVRFSSRETYLEWLKKDTVIYALVDSEDRLLGVVWYENLPLPWNEKINGKDPSSFGITYAIRTYAQARGKGLAVPFTEETLADFRKSSQYSQNPNNGIWLAVSKDNTAAISVYKKSGFKELGMRADNKKLLMIL